MGNSRIMSTNEILRFVDLGTKVNNCKEKNVHEILIETGHS